MRSLCVCLFLAKGHRHVEARESVIIFSQRRRRRDVVSPRIVRLPAPRSFGRFRDKTGRFSQAVRVQNAKRGFFFARTSGGGGRSRSARGALRERGRDFCSRPRKSAGAYQVHGRPPVGVPERVDVALRVLLEPFGRRANAIGALFGHGVDERGHSLRGAHDLGLRLLVLRILAGHLRQSVSRLVESRAPSSVRSRASPSARASRMCELVVAKRKNRISALGIRPDGVRESDATSKPLSHSSASSLRDSSR